MDTYTQRAIPGYDLFQLSPSGGDLQCMMLGMVVAGDLSDAELRVWKAFPAGATVNFGTSYEDLPAGGEAWGPDRRVRAEVLAALLCGAVELEPGQVGGICVDRAHITGKLNLQGATLKHPLRLNFCLVADGIDLSEATTQTLDLEGCHVGAIRLDGAKINGGFSLRSVHLDSKGALALTARQLTVTADMFCDGEFQASGPIDLSGANIGGQLDFGGARLDSRPALKALQLTVTADMFCDRGFQASGPIDLSGANIGGQLTFRSAHLDGKGGPALTAQGLMVTRSMRCDLTFQAKGEINLTGASIGGQLNLRAGHLDGKGGSALTARRLTVTMDMFCDLLTAKGKVDLMGAKIDTLVDATNSWPQRLSLDGLTYRDLTYMPARTRLDWLSLSTVYSPQPYDQLAAYYRRLGHDEHARRVLLAKQRQRTRQRPRWMRWWGWLQDALAGYGYAPGRALLLLAGAFVVGWLVFSARHPAPVGRGPHPTFNAGLYTLDVLIPAPAIGQASDWDPQGAGLAVAVGLHVLGWLLAITVIAAVTRAFSRD